ncbi:MULTISPECIES: hypothetical protein [unclassified Burkholderia]|uniref:hypothetical protein n=1 Tax=unclassified Burkholderia TaxID=2613784 RepID=UPI001423D933|nr:MULTISPECIES: hypothetical protein [unclassified Burkholderia]NIE82757.1 hypothetical protein [Burkholderia sp. Tr-860]NIF62196.1 hypothetical protein [Burkholderia sp. Cy-647]NIF99370.1 hypothetical protein [Burkholderia sp. Ax-1720]
MHSGRKTPFARDAHLPRASRAAGIFFRFAGRLLVFPAAIRRDGAVITLIRPMPDREVASSNFSMETGG